MLACDITETDLIDLGLHESIDIDNRPIRKITKVPSGFLYFFSVRYIERNEVTVNPVFVPMPKEWTTPTVVVREFVPERTRVVEC